MKKKILILNMIFVLLVGTMGCSPALVSSEIDASTEGVKADTENMSTNAERSENDVKSSKSSINNAEAYLKKYGKYTDMSNHISGWLSVCIESYLDNYGSEEELDVAELKASSRFNPENPSRTPILEGFYSEAEEVLKYTKQKPEFEQADEAMEALIGELTKTYDIMNEISDYYEAKIFNTDDFQKGKELHKKFIIQVNALIEVTQVFDKAFIPIAEEVVQKELERFKEKGHLSNYYAMKYILSAQAIQKFLLENEFEDENILEINLAQYSPIYETFQADYQEYMTYIQDSDGKEEGNLFIASEGFSQEIGTVLNLAKNINDIVETQDLSAGDNLGEGQVGSGQIIPIEQFHNYLFRAIGEYNKIIQ